MKEYQGEKAIISLTSWKARINAVGKTIFNLYKMCPGFHIVLCLSEEEFPKKEEELPEDLMLMANANIFEILWVYKNYKAFKKVLFTMDKYKTVPVITADDGCIYTYNYAEELYLNWLHGKDYIISITEFNHRVNNQTISYGGGGYGILFPPNCILKNYKHLLNDPRIIDTNHDDALYGILSHFLKIKWHFINMNGGKTFNEIPICEKEGLFHNKKFSVKSFYNLYDLIKNDKEFIRFVDKKLI